MKQTIEYTDNELLEQLREVIDEKFGEQIENLISAKTEELVNTEIEKQLNPIIEESLKSDSFIFHTKDRYLLCGKTIDEIVQRKVDEYMNERVYLYSDGAVLVLQIRPDWKHS